MESEFKNEEGGEKENPFKRPKEPCSPRKDKKLVITFRYLQMKGIHTFTLPF
jgi:hypothetical protein